MNRVFDERLELQLQEYEFAELSRPLTADTLMHAIPADEDSTPAMPAGGIPQYPV